MLGKARVGWAGRLCKARSYQARQSESKNARLCCAKLGKARLEKATQS
jgi:hypothetical protein